MMTSPIQVLLEVIEDTETRIPDQIYKVGNLFPCGSEVRTRGRRSMATIVDVGIHMTWTEVVINMGGQIINLPPTVGIQCLALSVVNGISQRIPP
jgi:hypothetical protein